MAEGIRRVFLGWEESALDRAAEWLRDRHGGSMGGVLVALPGSRAARALREKLALRSEPSWTPPRILTQGQLVDEMVIVDRPVAGRLARTLAWSRALAELPPDRLESIAARRPAVDDLRGWFGLAETVRALHAELAQEGIGFDRLAAESRRFAALAEAQERWRSLLETLGQGDPHESRHGAIERGSIDLRREVVLVGVADMNRLLRQLVLRLGTRATALVFAPEAEALAFDELGCLDAALWKDRDLDLPADPWADRWHVVDGPEAQAERTVEILAALDGRLAAEEISIGVCDEEVAPHLERRLAEEGIAAHHAAGTPLERARPLRLLSELAAWLPRRSYATYAALLRHPDLEAAVCVRSGAAELPAALDRYHALHLPAMVDRRWLRGEEEPVRAGHGALLEVLGELAATEPRALSKWPSSIRAFLASVYFAELDPAVEGERVLAAALSVLSDVLGEIERLPGELGTAPASASDAIGLALSVARGEALPARPPTPGEPVIEMLGWLELPLDEARVLVVTGFQEGFVPRSRRDDPFLPDSLRRKLGLPSADDRIARDVYAARVLLASKRELAFISGRRSGSGDPLLPSRLAFHVPKDRLLDRVERLQAGSGAEWTRRSRHGPRSGPAPAPGSMGAGHRRLPQILPIPELDAMHVTAFRDYLRSPYAFYLKHVLRIETLDDAAREMDPLAFGSLAHGVLEAFGRGELCDATDDREIERWLREEVDVLALARFGPRPLPAVAIQVAQLAHRLGFFAREQAQRAREGWRIQHVEWKPATPVALEMGGAEKPMPLRGRIDRIDVRERPGSSRVEWTILDYKTGGSAGDPEKAHRSRGVWRDLQLPLYTLLARELGLEGEPRLGFFRIGKDEPESRVVLWDYGRPDLESAFEAARGVVRRVRGGKPFEEVGDLPDQPILLALAGQGLVEAGAGEAGAPDSGAPEPGAVGGTA